MKNTHIGIKKLNKAEKLVLCAVFASLLTVSGKPVVARAGSLVIPAFEATSTEVGNSFSEPAPKVKTITIKSTMITAATAYSSTPDQTDDTPFITSNGKQVYDGLVAANWLPYNTKIRIPDLYGDKIFTVNDRMNARYKTGRLDVWMKTRQEAIQFGLRRIRIQIVEVE